MPFVLLIFGVLLLVAGARDKQSELFTLLAGDVKGFIPWIVSILVIGFLGYIKPIKPITDAFLVLVIVVLFLSNGGFFTQLITQTGMSTQASFAPLPSLHVQSSTSSLGSLAK